MGFKNKRKIINDPVYGFITIPSDFIFDLIEHPFFQRLRYIKQLSMTHLVYPGALHTRFHHALGAMHLMEQALDILSMKGVQITEDEREGALIAILLHDIGHGPFSHSLEKTIIEGVSHEDLSYFIMNHLNSHFGGKLTLAIEIFQNKYSKNFLHQLVSSQLDTDRMDYLNRDSFFTGVSEGVISFDRIIKMLHVVDNELVVESKGIYSIEKFLIARRLMYWQVYLHKTVLSAEGMLLKILKRAKYLYQEGDKWPVSRSLEHFLRNKMTCEDFVANQEHLEKFVLLDDVDVLAALKSWMYHPDQVLSNLCSGIINRNLYHTEFLAKEPDEGQWCNLRQKAKSYMEENGLKNWNSEDIVWGSWIENSAYQKEKDEIKILMKDGTIADIANASDLSNLETLSKQVRKFAITYPKEINIEKGFF